MLEARFELGLLQIHVQTSSVDFHLVASRSLLPPLRVVQSDLPNGGIKSSMIEKV